MLGRVLKVLQLFVLTVFLFFSALKVKQMTNSKTVWYTHFKHSINYYHIMDSNCFDDQETPLDFLFCSFFLK